MGESAGATSIFCHLTADGGKAETLFQSAILQSIAFPRPAEGRWEWMLETATRLAGRPITNGEELAALDADTLIQVNGIGTFEGVSSAFAGPTVDGTYIPDWPSNLLAQ
jgi:carboxylesterase type B